MEDVEVPQFFICPISLQIMRDPVTVVTGITYDRESIEKWFSSGKNKNNHYCPVTKQILPKHSDNLITPNHTLRRLIQAWCTANLSQEIDRTLFPKSPLAKTHILKLLEDLCVSNPESQLQTLKKLETLANENESNRRSMAEAGVAKSMVSLIITCFNRHATYGLEEALRVLNLIVTNIINNNTSLLSSDFLDSITWIMRRRTHSFNEIRSLAVSVLKSIIELEPSYQLERLKPELFEAVVWVLRDRLSQQATKAALHVLLENCPWGRNRIKIIEAGAVFHLIELELIGSQDKRTTELIFGVLDHLCRCADGRAKFLSHAAGIAMLTKRILRVSHGADDRAVRILSSICKFFGTGEVVQEMLRVGAVSKLCMVLQAESEASVKAKAREVLRLHSNVWSNSPCIHVYLLTRYPIR